MTLFVKTPIWNTGHYPRKRRATQIEQVFQVETDSRLWVSYYTSLFHGKPEIEAKQPGQVKFLWQKEIEFDWRPSLVPHNPCL